MPLRSLHRLLAVAGLAVVAAWACSGLTGAADRELHALYARTLIGPSATHSLLLVGLDDETDAAWQGPGTAAQWDALATTIAAARPRLVIWPERQVESGTDDPGYVAGDPADAAPGGGVGVDPLVGPTLLRAHSPEFPADVLRSLGLPARGEPVPARYVTRLPTVSARRVAAGEIPADTFRDRVVIVGRTDARATTVETPLGLMSPAQVEAHALLGLLDGAAWGQLPAWVRPVALVLWALGLARVLRGRGPAAIVAITALAGSVAIAADAALFEAGLVRVGAGAALVIAGTVGAARLLAWIGHALAPAGLSGKTDEAFANTASGMRKVSDA